VSQVGDRETGEFTKPSANLVIAPDQLLILLPNFSQVSPAICYLSGWFPRSQSKSNNSDRFPSQSQDSFRPYSGCSRSRCSDLRCASFPTSSKSDSVSPRWGSKWDLTGDIFRWLRIPHICLERAYMHARVLYIHSQSAEDDIRNNRRELRDVFQIEILRAVCGQNPRQLLLVTS